MDRFTALIFRPLLYLVLGQVAGGLGDGGAGVGEPADHVGGQLGIAHELALWGHGDSSHVTKYNVYIPFNSSNLIAKLGAGQCRVSVQYRQYRTVQRTHHDGDQHCQPPVPPRPRARA